MKIYYYFLVFLASFSINLTGENSKNNSEALASITEDKAIDSDKKQQEESDLDAEISMTKKLVLAEIILMLQGTNGDSNPRFLFLPPYRDENYNLIFHTLINGSGSEFDDKNLLDFEKNTARQSIIKIMKEKKVKDNEVFFLDKQTKCNATICNYSKEFFVECTSCVTQEQFKRFMKEARRVSR